MPLQNTEYDPFAPNHKEVARRLQLPWDVVGPMMHEGATVHDNQKWRPNSGRFASAGGYKKNQQLIYNASGRKWFFSYHNPKGHM